MGLNSEQFMSGGLHGKHALSNLELGNHENLSICLNAEEKKEIPCPDGQSQEISEFTLTPVQQSAKQKNMGRSRKVTLIYMLFLF